MSHPPIPERYLKARRKALERFYCGQMTVYADIEHTDPITHHTSFRPEPVLIDIPCRLSKQTAGATRDENGPVAEETINVILAPEYKIPPGSVIEIKQHLKSGRYQQSGVPRIYADHQQIDLVVYEEHA